MLNSEFNEWSTAPNLDFYPLQHRAEIDAINEWIYDGINNGVYKSGFATAQEPYEKAVTVLFKSLDRVEEILKKEKYLVGGVFTEADIRLFTTIVRFDPVYHTHFKCNLKTISSDYPNILRWARMIYQMGMLNEPKAPDNITIIRLHSM